MTIQSGLFFTKRQFVLVNIIDGNKKYIYLDKGQFLIGNYYKDKKIFSAVTNDGINVITKYTNCNSFEYFFKQFT